MKHVLLSMLTGSMLLLTCGGFAPKEPAKAAPATPQYLDILISPSLPQAQTTPNVLQRFPIVVDQKNPADYPIMVTQGRGDRYPIRVITPTGVTQPGPAVLTNPQIAPVAPKYTPPVPLRRK
ncbi:MAG: hypothetical protein K0Q72_1177 [Armatimonadetes bacterium]|jgi:hypothetical protein|nr:hypothetical protein [Armatimonadota bacterium]